MMAVKVMAIWFCGDGTRKVRWCQWGRTSDRPTGQKEPHVMTRIPPSQELVKKSLGDVGSRDFWRQV